MATHDDGSSCRKQGRKEKKVKREKEWRHLEEKHLMKREKG